MGSVDADSELWITASVFAALVIAAAGREANCANALTICAAEVFTAAALVDIELVVQRHERRADGAGEHATSGLTIDVL